MFRKYEFFQEFFIKLVRQSHPSFAETSYEEFFKNRILKNSGSRAKCKGIRSSSVKYRSAHTEMETLVTLDESHEIVDEQIKNDDENDCDSGETKHSTNTVSIGASNTINASGTPANDDKSTATDSVKLSETTDDKNLSDLSPSVDNILTNGKVSIVPIDAMVASTKHMAHQTRVIKRKRTHRVDQFNLSSQYLLDENSADSDVELSNEVSFLFLLFCENVLHPIYDSFLIFRVKMNCRPLKNTGGV